jgi:hypothetical protein
MDDFHRMLAEFFSEYGFDATLTRQLPGVPNDDDGTITTDTSTVSIRAIKSAVLGNMAGSRTKLGTLIQEADQVLYVQPNESLAQMGDIDPTSDCVTINGKLWKVLALKEYDPSASDCVLYELYIKR